MPLVKTVLNPIQLVTNYKRFGINGIGQSGGGGNVTGKFSGGFNLNAGNSATSYAKLSYNSSFATMTSATGAAINFALGVGFFGIGYFDLGTATAGQAIRIILGDDSESTVPFNSTQNALGTRGFGFEIYNDAGTKKIRLFAHDGTTYSTSAGVSGFQFAFTYTSQFYIKNDSAGNVYLYLAENATQNGLVPPLPATPIITLAGGPTSSTSAKRYVTVNIITNGVNNPGSAFASYCALDESIFTVGI
jgi:hypothetical protein